MQSLDELLDEARSGLDRVAPGSLAAHLEAGALVVDIRDSADQAAEGLLPGAVTIRRSVLEWRLAPTSEWRTYDLGPADRVILVCNDGCSSVIAAAVLQRLGLDGATDLLGGYRAWSRWTEHGHAECHDDDASDDEPGRVADRPRLERGRTR